MNPIKIDEENCEFVKSWRANFRKLRVDTVGVVKNKCNENILQIILSTHYHHERLVLEIQLSFSLVLVLRRQ